MSSSFDALGVPADLVSTLKARGIDAPFAIQTLTLADGCAGRDVSGRAPTGSGKTLAFGIPIVARVKRAAARRSSPPRSPASSSGSAGPASSASPRSTAAPGTASSSRPSAAVSTCSSPAPGASPT